MSRNVVVIGAGVVGAATALELLRDGHSVQIIEPAEPGGEQAASYGNAGWLSSMSVIPPASPGLWKKVPKLIADPLGPLAIRWMYLPKAAPWLIRYLLAGWTEAKVENIARALRPLIVDAPRLHQGLAEEAGVSRLIERRGLIYVYPSRAAFEAEAMSWRIRRKVGIEWVELSTEELRQREPDLAPRYTFGIYVAEGGHCRSPGTYVAALAALAQQRGAGMRRTRASGFKIEAGKLRAVVTPDGDVPCDAAVICAGAWSKTLAAAAGDRVPLETERGYHAVLDHPAAYPRSPLNFSDLKLVMNMTEHGLRSAGQVEIAGLDAAPDWRRAEILRDHMLRCFPELPRDLPPERFKLWMGHRPSTPDGLPCLGRSRATPDIVYAFGHGHVGLVAAPRTGRIAAQLIAGLEPEAPIAPFDPRRFRA